MFIKILAGVMLLISGMLTGTFLGNKYKKRRNFFNDFLSFSQALCTDITFLQKPLPQILNGFNCKSDFNRCLRDFGDNIENPDDINLSVYNYLKQDEKNLLINFFCSLGKSDCETQLEIINKSAAQAETIYKDCTAEQKKYVPLYAKLGFFAGAVIFIIIL